MTYIIDWSGVAAYLAIAISIFTYFRHEKRIKQQERLLNDYQLTKINEEKDNKRKALVKANFIRGSRGSGTIKIYNAGQCMASNIQFNLTPTDQDVFILNKSIFPLEFLNPQESVELNLSTHMGSPETIKITLSWEDNFASSNEYKQILSI